MRNHVIDCTPRQLVPTPPASSSTTTPRHIAIPVEELSAALNLKAANAKGKDPANDFVKKPKGQEASANGECRFCHDEDLHTKMEAPCSCNGTLKYAHRVCIQRWCDTKGNIICEICRQSYHPNYVVTNPRPDETVIDVSEGWMIPGTNTQIHSPLRLAEMSIDRMSETLNDDCNFSKPSGGVLLGTGLIIFLAMVTIRDSYYCTPPKDSDLDRITYILCCVLLIILAPIYILSWIFECSAFREHNRERERDRTNPVTVASS